MHNKIYAVICTALVLISLTVSAFAAPGEGETTSEPETVSEELVKGEESTSEELPTVNISDGSVQAIAEAVGDDGTIYVTNKLGETYSVDPLVAPYWSDYTYKFVVSTGFTAVFNDYWSVTVGTNPFLRYADGYESPAAGQTTAQYVSSNSYGQVYYGNVVWANFDICDADGNLLREADAKVVVPYTVSFDTGFDDLTFDSQSSLSLSLPSPTYPGYVFVGWYLDADYSTAYTSAYEFTADTTLYAKWEETGAMAFFTNSLLSSFSTALNVEPILYVVSLMALLLIIGIFRKFVFVRM